MEKSGLPGLLEDAVISPTTECIKEVIREWAHGTRLSRTDWDFQKLWDAAKEAIESAYSAGLVIAGIRLISGLICAGNREPEYYVNIEYAKQVYAEYGDSRWKGVANLVWRFSSLKDANSELIWAQCLARKDHKEMDVARIALLRGLLAQAAGVWSEADKLFESFVLVAKETIKDLETAQLRNEEDRIRLEKKYIINPSGKIIIEKLIADPRAVDAVAKGSIEALVKSVSPRTERGTRGFIGEIVENRVGRTEIENRIQGLNRFIAYCEYRPTLRYKLDYQVERVQDWVDHSNVFAKLRILDKGFVIRTIGKMRSQQTQTTLENVQKDAPRLTDKAGR